MHRLNKKYPNTRKAALPREKQTHGQENGVCEGKFESISHHWILVSSRLRLCSRMQH